MVIILISHYYNFQVFNCNTFFITPKYDMKAKLHAAAIYKMDNTK